MNKNPLSHFLSSLSRFKLWILLLFVLTAIVFSGEHFVDTLKFFFQWIHSRMTEARPDYPSAELEREALYFFSKTATAYLCGLSLLVMFGVFFGPALGFTDMIDELVDEKNNLVQNYKAYNELQRTYQSFIVHLDKHRNTQLAVIAKTDRVVEELNLSAIGLSRTLQDLSGKVESLQAARLVQEKEKEKDAMPKLDTDQGLF